MRWKALFLKPGITPLSPPVLAERRENAVVLPPTAMGINPPFATNRPLSVAFSRQPAKTKPLRGGCSGSLHGMVTTSGSGNLYCSRFWVFLDCTELDRFRNSTDDTPPYANRYANAHLSALHQIYKTVDFPMFL